MRALLLVVLAASGCISAAWGETVRQTMDGGMDVEIAYPDSVFADRTFSVSVLVQNNGWEEKRNVSLAFRPDGVISSVSEGTISIPRIVQDGSYGQTVDFAVDADAMPGTYFINVDYSQVLVANNRDPQEPTGTSTAIPVIVLERARVNIHITAPESIFAGAEFPITVEIISDDMDISDAVLQIVPPGDIGFRGETRHAFSFIQKGEPVRIDSRIVTPEEEVAAERGVPFQVSLTYRDDDGGEVSDSKTVSTVLRPRTFMELTTDGGIWVGSFFIAPYISLGTIIGIPSGAVLTLLIRRSQGSGRRRAGRRRG